MKVEMFRNIYHGFFVFPVLLAGCTLAEPDHFSPTRVQVEEKRFSENTPVSAFTAEYVEGLGREFQKRGDGAVDLTVTYDPQSRRAGALRARDEAARIAALLRSVGMKDVKESIMPVMGAGDEMQALLSYTAYNALPPEGCDVMPGVKTRTVNADDGYKMGCTFDTIFARQIARPKDLKGNKTQGATDGRRAANIVDLYRKGDMNQPLAGDTASGK